MARPAFYLRGFLRGVHDNTRLVFVLSSLEPHLEPLIRKLELERCGKRNRYPVRVMMRSMIAGYVYQMPVKNEVIRELRRNGSLRRLIGIETMSAVPNAWQFSRFVGRLSEDENLALLEESFDRCVEELRGQLPGFGENLGIDGTAVRSGRAGLRTRRPDLQATLRLSGAFVRSVRRKMGSWRRS